ncbi:MAG: hypothetical protein U0800_12615 [Isosphaeraceae bacterium]
MTAAPICPALPENELLAKAKLDIRDGRIHYGLYQQDGSMQPMDCPDTHDNRLLVSWIQRTTATRPAEQMRHKRQPKGRGPESEVK